MDEWKHPQAARRAPGLAGRGPTVPVVNDADREALQWLTVDELAARRRALVRDYDRELRRPDPDREHVAALWAEADAIEQVQRGRR